MSKGLMEIDWAQDAPLLFITPYAVSTYGYFLIGRHHCRAIYPGAMPWLVQGRVNLRFSGILRYSQVYLRSKGPLPRGRIYSPQVLSGHKRAFKGVEFTDLRFYQVL